MQIPVKHESAGLTRLLRWVAASLLVLLSIAAQAQDFLAPERAFAMQARQVSDRVIGISYQIAPGYYMYRERFELEPPDAPVSAQLANLPPGKVKYDPTFEKDMALFYNAVEFMLEVSPWPASEPSRRFAIQVISQGCAEAGLCYPPMASAVFLEPQGDGYTLVGQQPIVDFDRPLAMSAANTGSAPGGNGLNWSELLGTGSDTGIAQALTDGQMWQILLLFFGLGLLLSLTPCVLPMVPILSALIVGQKSGVTRLRGLALAAAYVAAMSVVYTIFGVLAGLTGAGLAAWLQTPWVLTIFALLLALLGLAMFDVIRFEMPGSIQTRMNNIAARLPGGNLAAAAAMGAISAVIVGPCVAAPLAGALLYISQTGDVVLGGSALFSMAWGMGLPLLIVGVSAGALLPRAGDWMSGVKAFFGILLFATAWWMVSPVVSDTVQILGWVVLAIFASVLLGAFEPLSAMRSGEGLEPSLLWPSLRKALGILLAAIAAIWLIGLASGGRSLLQPLAHMGSTAAPVAEIASGSAVQKPRFELVRSVEELDQVLKNSTRPVMLDFYADWCVSCKEMEAFTFSSPEVAQKMDRFLLLKADVTANTPQDRALLRRFNLFGPPGIMFFEPGGRYRQDIRVIGFQDAKQFSETLDKILRSPI